MPLISDDFADECDTGDPGRFTQRRYEKMINFYAAGKQESFNPDGDGDAPDDPSFEKGKVR